MVFCSQTWRVSVRQDTSYASFGGLPVSLLWRTSCCPCNGTEVCQCTSATVPCSDEEGNTKRNSPTAQRTSSPIPIPPSSSQFAGRFVFPVGLSGAAAGIPPVGAEKSTAEGKACARGSGAPHFTHIVFEAEFLSPQLVHKTVRGAEAVCSSLPEARAFPPLRSAPHWEQTVAVAGLRVPQNPQWISGPAEAASI